MLRHKNDCVRDVFTAPSDVYLNLSLNLFYSYFLFDFHFDSLFQYESLQARCRIPNRDMENRDDLRRELLKKREMFLFPQKVAGYQLGASIF